MTAKKLFSSLFLLTFLVSCEDLASNRPKRTVDPNKPTITAIEGNGSTQIRSHMHRERGVPVLSSAEEILKTISNQLPGLYRIVPLMDKDNEGSTQNIITRTRLGRPIAECGVGPNFTGIDARITDCFQKNTTTALWDGLTLGAAGEGIWKLVSKTLDGKEIWFDGRTGMVWSHIITLEQVSAFNWCQASGNTQDDSMTEIINCRVLGDMQSLCDGNSLAGLEGQVKWRLPTRNDFLQADLNGLRFVLIPENQKGLWTATMRASSKTNSEAWVYDSTEGTLFAGTLNDSRQVRCIGASVR